VNDNKRLYDLAQLEQRYRVISTRDEALAYEAGRITYEQMANVLAVRAIVAVTIEPKTDLNHHSMED